MPQQDHHAGPAGPASRAEAQLAAHKLFRAMFRLVLKTLERCGVPEADREDVAQVAVLAALVRWTTYREDAGGPTQWLRGIARNHALRYLRTQARLPVLAGERLLEMSSDAATAEDEVMMDDLIGKLPLAQRKVVWLYEVAGLTFDEIAAREKIPKVKAHRLHAAGMKQLRAWLEGDRAQMPAVFVPVSLEALFEAQRGPEPPAEVVERAWRGLSAALGFDPPPDSEPPASYVRPAEPTEARDSAVPPSRRAPRLLSLLVWSGSVLAGILVSPCAEDDRHERLLPAPLPVVVAAASTPPDPGLRAPDAATAASTGAEPAPPAPAVTSTGVRRDRSRADGNDALGEELEVIDRAQSALASLRYSDSLAAVAEHAERFPTGQRMDTREWLWSAACARLRAATKGGMGAPDVRCAGRL